MDEQEGHPVPVPFHESLPQHVVEGGTVSGQPDDEHKGIGNDGYDLGISKLHIVRKTKV